MDELARIKEREALRRSEWAEDFDDDLHRCRHCGYTATVWEGLSHEDGCLVATAFELEAADFAWLVGRVEQLSR
jgi:hypothetical protein